MRSAERPRVIAVANQKGGVGKTTTTLNLGAALAEAGHRVLLVDLDPQAALTAAFGLNPYALSGALEDLLTAPGDGDGAPAGEALAELARPVGERLTLVPTSGRMALRELALGRDDADGAAPVARLLTPPPAADFVLLDTPPNLGPLTRGALAAAGELLIPVACEYLAIRGVRGVLMAVWEVHQRLNPELDLLGVLPNRYRPGSPHCREVVVELRRVFRERVFDAVVADSEELARAPVTHRPIVELAPGSAAADAYRELAREIAESRRPTPSRKEPIHA